MTVIVGGNRVGGSTRNGCSYLYNGIAGIRRLQQHQLEMEEQDCQNLPTAQTFLTKTLAHFVQLYNVPLMI